MCRGTIINGALTPTLFYREGTQGSLSVLVQGFFCEEGVKGDVALVQERRVRVSAVYDAENLRYGCAQVTQDRDGVGDGATGCDDVFYDECVFSADFRTLDLAGCSVCFRLFACECEWQAGALRQHGRDWHAA